MTPKTQLPVEIPQLEVVEIDDGVRIQDSDIIIIEPCPTPTTRTPMRISYKTGCASVLAKWKYPDYYPELDLTELAVELIRRHGYRIVRRTDSGNCIIIEFAKP